MAKYDQGGGCACGLKKECDCGSGQADGTPIKKGKTMVKKEKEAKQPKQPKEDTNKLRARIFANSKLEDTSMLADSIIFQKKDMISTPVPMLNVALSGLFDGGLLPGTTMVAGPSKHFKSMFGLLLMAAFLDKYKDGVVLFYDSELGAPKQYFKIFGIDEKRVIHSPVDVVEDLTHDILNQVNGIAKGEHVFILIDSIGNLASAKEIADAIKGSDKADMTRAKKIKSLFRMITSKLVLKGIPMVIINHTYQTQETYSKDVTGGGTGPIYGANDIWIIGRQQDTEGEGADKELMGFNFVIKIEKSRTIKEKSKILINVSFNEGIQKWSGLFDLAMEAGVIVSPSKGWYQISQDTPKFHRGDVEYDGKFWNQVLKSSELVKFIEDKYKLPDAMIIEEDDILVEETTDESVS